MLSKSYCLVSVLGRFLVRVVEMFSEFALSVQLRSELGESMVRDAFRGAATSFPYVFVFMLVEEENDMKLSGLYLLIAFKKDSEELN